MTKKKGSLKLYKATLYAVGSPKKITTYIEANDYNQAVRLIKANPAFKRWGQRPRAYVLHDEN
jgi:hypothetical protein